MVSHRPIARAAVGLWILASILSTLMLACREPQPSREVLTAGTPLHLAAYLATATITGSELPPMPPKPREWQFDRPQPAWQPVGYAHPFERLPTVHQLDDAVRLTLSDEEGLRGWRRPWGGLYVDLPDWDLADWAYVIVTMRASSQIRSVELGLNLNNDADTEPSPAPFDAWIPAVPVIADASVQSYVLRLDRSGEDPLLEPWRQLGVYIGADEPDSIELVSVRIVPREADFADATAGTRMTERGGEHRRAIFTHGDARLDFRVDIPAGGRLDFGMGVLRDQMPVGFRVSAVAGRTASTVLFEENYGESRAWGMRSVEMSHLAGQTVTLTLETAAPEGAVALWGTPVLAGERRVDAHRPRPNVILYIIDGAGADYMSVSGYNRRNTPHLEALAAQGAVFERTYSNASWTKASTASFMTSLPHSALGGFRSEADAVPAGATTMAEHLHAAGYQTAVIVSNPYAASLSGLERGADYLHETGIEPNNSESSRLLHESFWRWRESQPAEPFWVHLQSTDIHEPFAPVAPFSGLFVDPAMRRSYESWDPKLYPGGGWRDLAAYEEHGIDRERYAWAQQGLYDEAMAHNDYRIGELVARLQARGEWSNTLLIIAADHGYPAACHRLMDPLPPIWGPLFNSHETRVPLIFVWPSRIAGGQRFSTPVSMLDLLPTVLDLLELPAPESIFGRSLAPLLLAQDDWQPRPVVLDEFNVDPKTGEMKGLIEVVDGWWGASLEIGEGAANHVGGVGVISDEQRPAPLLLYDLRKDPFTLQSLHAEHPDLVEKYRRFLHRQWAHHQEMRRTLGDGGRVNVGQEQLEALRTLGYID